MSKRIANRKPYLKAEPEADPSWRCHGCLGSDRVISISVGSESDNGTSRWRCTTVALCRGCLAMLHSAIVKATETHDPATCPSDVEGGPCTCCGQPSHTEGGRPDLDEGLLPEVQRP